MNSTYRMFGSVPARLVPPPVLRSARVTARPYATADQQAFIHFMTDPEVNYYMDNNVLSEDEASELFDNIQHIYRNPPAKPIFLWAVEFGSICVGHLELKKTKFTSSTELEVVYMLDRKYWRKGIISEILIEIMDFSASLGYKVVATVDKGNGRSIRLLEKAGIESMLEVSEDSRVWKIILNNA